ncbi:terminase small subunit [Paraburkholderia sp. Ac-20342]|uniref:terminase small subunit n=1 Tax=Paraburkholderia sp. Ac-20342 TaxID=2703889 RepID=UPI0019817FEE|nr:terminase small subunit [Paraburkholderia sp. Ac-20342]MBN3848158.1 terminase small subunit [Paraburkholderia sp. Ac-20342]
MTEPTRKPIPKRERFVDEFLVDLNGTQAAIRAGYSPKTAVKQASRLLTKADIQEAIAARRLSMASKFEITRERVLEEYARLAFSDPRNFYRPDGTLKDVPELDAATAASLAGFEVVTQQTVEVDEEGNTTPAPTVTKKVKWADKKSALDSIARLMGWNQDRVKSEISGPAGGPIVTTTVDVTSLSEEQLRALASIKVD